MNIIKTLENGRTIYLVGMIIVGSAVWAADQRYAQKSDIHNALALKEIREIDDKIYDLEIEITPVNMIANQAKINRYKAKKDLMLKGLKE